MSSPSYLTHTRTHKHAHMYMHIDAFHAARKQIDDTGQFEECKRVITTCLNEGVCIDAYTHDGNWSLLHFASRNGALDLCEWLLAQGADVNVVSVNMDTPLHYASRQGYFLVCQMLLRYGADVNFCNGHGFIPLHFTGDCHVRNLLLAHGADNIWPLSRKAI